jgi:hypothetical protein
LMRPGEATIKSGALPKTAVYFSLILLVVMLNFTSFLKY